MDTNQLLDLFHYSGESRKQPNKADGDSKGVDAAGEVSSKKKGGIKAVLENLEELWDDSQYEEEYNLTSFLESLSK